jgi:cytochrome P450
MRLVGWPIEKMDEFRTLAVDFFTSLTDPIRSVEKFRSIQRQVRELLICRASNRADDLFSRLMDDTVDGRKLSLEELESIGCLLFLAGLDSVASTGTYIFFYLARHPEWQALLAREPEKIEPFIEEAMRKFGIVNIVRVAKQEVIVGDVQLNAGDPIMCLLPMAGLDDRKNPEPDEFRIDRVKRQHLIFGGGVHTCLGNGLARRELKILVEEWLKRIPRFQLQRAFLPEYRLGQQTSLKHLLIEWQPSPGA